MARDRRQEIPRQPRSAVQPPVASVATPVAASSSGGAGQTGLEGRRSAGDGRPSETVRGVATLLLSLYLAGLALSVASNSASGTSALLETIHSRFFSPWMVPAWLDVGHDTRLTYGLPEDADHHIEVLPVEGSGRGSVRIPAAVERSERAARWRRLARAAALAEEGDEQAGVLPAAIGGGLFAKVGNDDLLVRVGRVVPPEFSAAASPPVAETALEARVRRIDGDVQLIPSKPAEEMAPVIDRAPLRGGEGSGS